MKIISSGDELKVSNQFAAGNGVERLLFADGTSFNREQIASGAWYRTGNGDDNINASAGDDVLSGGLGNDYLRGNGGGDRYVYASGDGNDRIDDSSGSTTDIDTLKLTDLTAADVTFSRIGGDLQILVNGTGQAIKVEYQFYSQTENWGIEKVEFSDNTQMDLAAINVSAWYRGGSGDDSLNGSAWRETLWGGFGNDYLSGKGGDDRYVYSSGDGNDRIDDSSGSTTEIDTLKFTDLNASDITFSRVGGDLQISVNGTAQAIKVEYQFYSQTANWGIEKIEFADNTHVDLATINAAAWYRGSSGDDSINGSRSTWSETLWGGLGNDYISGKEGNDLYVYSSGDGNDRIDDSSGSTTEIDTLKFTDLNATDVTLSRVNGDLQMLVNSTGQTIKVEYQFYSQTANWGIEKIEFANGSSWDFAAISANAWIRGTFGNDAISGTAWNDTIFGDAGNDTLSGGAGDDTFIFRTGFGQDLITDFNTGHDRLEFRDGLFADAGAALAAASTQGNDVIITVDASTTLLLQNVALANLHVDDFRIV